MSEREDGAIDLSIVIPVYGCAGCLEELADRISMTLAGVVGSYEFILVDDRSPDQAWERIIEIAENRPQLRAIRLARNFGQHSAIAAGIEAAIGDIVVVMDCDLQDRPEQIPKLLEALDHNPPVSVAFASRKNRTDAALKKLTSRLFFKTLSWLTGVHQDHSTANFGAYRRKVIEAINAMPERKRCFPLMVKWTGYPSVTVEVEHGQRHSGNSAYTLKKLLNLAIDIVLSYSDKPLRMVVKLGLAFAVFSVAFAIFSAVRYFSGDIAVAGFTSIIASIWLVGGAITASLGVVGLYVGRIFSDVKGRPYYLVDQTFPPDWHGRH